MSEEERDIDTPSSDAKSSSIQNYDDQVEEKIQVDRKRLEAMITGQPVCGFANPPQAEEFFRKVAQCTGAEIYWPSRLKVGAKTKKDPFVKVSGLPAQVEGARQMINTYLKIKRDRVTLKIEIHHSEHSKIIGRQGRNTQDIMRETMCHIHFPDSNKNHEAEKNDQVSISGSVEQVECARKWLRDLTPLSVTFDLPNRPYQAVHDVQKSVGTRGIYITFRENYDGHLTCLIKGTQQYEAAIIKAVAETVKLFQCSVNTICKTILTVHSSLQNIFKNDSSLQQLAAQTGTSIQSSLNDADEVNIQITGPVFGILHARRSLIGLLPVSIHFDRVVEPSCDLFDKHIIEATYGVTISEKWRKYQGSSKLIVAVGTERYVSDLFRVRERVLNILPETRINAQEHFDENRLCNSQLVSDSLNLGTLYSNNVCDQQKNTLSSQKKTDPSFSLNIFRDVNTMCTANDTSLDLADALIDRSITSKSCQQDNYSQKTPDPTYSPIAHSVLVGAKRIDEKRLMMTSNNAFLFDRLAIYDPSVTPVRQPTDFWAGYGFSNSLPAEVLKTGLGFYDGAIKSQYDGRAMHSGQDSKIGDTTVTVQPQLTNGLSSVLEEEEFNANSNSNSNSFLNSSSFQNFQRLQQPCPCQTKKSFSASTSVFDIGNDVKWDIRVFVDPAMVLAQLGCTEYLPQFREQEVTIKIVSMNSFNIIPIDMEAFLLLDEKSLQDIGVSTIGARKKLFNAIISRYFTIKNPYL
uniref:SAM domain-containing protein n=1 Tax=Syphacia muris TaxID=451379 RepID=A0A0N5ALL0_9BILA